MGNKEEPCQGCGVRMGTEPHTCPYAEKINDITDLCNCCSECEHECCMDI